MNWQWLLRIATCVVLAWSCAGLVPSFAADPTAEQLDQQVSSLFSQGRYLEAIAPAQAAVALREKTLGPGHPMVARSLVTLAIVYLIQDRYAEVEPPCKRALEIFEKTPDSEVETARALNALASAYRWQARFAEAEARYRQALALREKVRGPYHAEVGESLANLAGLLSFQERFSEAEPLYKRALEIVDKVHGKDSSSAAVTLHNLGLLYENQGRYSLAESLYRRSVEIGRKVLPPVPGVASALDKLASVLVLQGRLAEAEPLYRECLELVEKALGPDHPHTLGVVNNLATLYWRQGRRGEVEPLLRRSLETFEKTLGPDHNHVAVALNNLAALYIDLGRQSEAEQFMRRSLAISEKNLGLDHPTVAGVLSNLAHLLQTQGRIEAALSYSRRATAIVARRALTQVDGRTSGPGAEQRSARPFFAQNVALLQAANEPGAVAEAFRVAQLGHWSTAGRALTGMAARFGAGSDATAGRIRERQDLDERWKRLDGALLASIGQTADKRDAQREAALRQSMAETARQLDALDSRILAEFPRFAELSRPQPVELAAVQALLAPDEAIAMYLVSDKAAWLWIVRRDQAAMHALAISAADLRDEVKALRRHLDPQLNPRLEPFDAARAHALHQRILAPGAALLDGVRHLFVVPDEALVSLPLAVLVTESPTIAPQTAADHRAVAWLARRYATTVLPSVGSLPALRQLAQGSRAPLPFAGIGTPVLGGKTATVAAVDMSALFRGSLANVDEVRRLSPLPETADELRAVANAMGASEQDLYLGERASEPMVRQAGLERYRVIEFATHGLMSGALKGLAEPALVLTPPSVATPENDGLLTASEVATLKLDAEWIVLSACNTAAGDGTPDGGGLSGLARSFFYAGARSVLVSHWAVPSAAAVDLVTGAFDALRRDPSIGRAEAVRRSELELIDSTTVPKFAHPLFWAPFVLVGEGAPGR